MSGWSRPTLGAEAAEGGRVALACEGLDFAYGEAACLRGVDFRARRGEITCVLGRNGVGKTTLMRSLMGLLKPRGGRVLLDGRDVTGLPAYARSRRGLKLVPQGREIFPLLTVEENLRVGVAGRAQDVGGGLDEAYRVFPALKALRHRRGGDLSGGQQQQLAIARAILGQPQVLLLDEPTEGIQPSIIEEIGSVLRRMLVERDMAIVLVEQYLDFVAEIGHRYVVMERGQITAEGQTDDLHSAAVRRRLSV